MNFRCFMILLVSCLVMAACKNSEQTPKKEEAQRTVYTRDGHHFTTPQMIGGSRALKRALTYPNDAAKYGIHGTVMLNFIITKKGKVKDIKVVRAPDPSLARAAIHTIKKMHFKPALKDGKPIKMRIAWPVGYYLK